MLRELRVAARSLRKAAGFTIASVLTLGVGIGATTALFTVVYGILLRPLPYPNPDLLVRFTAVRTIAGRTYGAAFSAVETAEWGRQTHAFAETAAVAGTAFGVSDEGGTSNVAGAYVSGDFFHLVGRPPLLGRGLAPGDAHAPVVVVSRRLWTERLGADPQVIGRALMLDRHEYTVVGVADDELRIPSDRTDVWMPMGRGQDLGVPWLIDPAGGGAAIFGRLKPGVTLAQARADVRAAAPAVAAIYPRTAKERQVDVVRFSDWLTDAVRPTLLILGVAVALVLVITCANLVNLQLARQLAMGRDTAVHVALGATRVRLAAHALAESALVVTLGSAAAVAIAWSGVRVLLWMRPADIPRIDAIRIDVPVLLFVLAAAALATCIVALAPVVRVGGVDPAILLQRATRTHTPGASAQRFRAVLVAGEVAMAIVLLVGAVLLANSFVRLVRTDLGVRPDHVMTAFVDLEAGQATAATHAGPREAARVAEMLRRLSSDPRVESAAAGTSMPPSVARLRFSFKWVGGEGTPPIDKAFDAAPVTPALFRTLGIPVIAGRDFAITDDGQAPPVAILSRAAARELFGTGDAIGRELPAPALVPDRRAPGVTIVGVVGDVHYGGVDAVPAPALYVPFAQYPFRVVHLFTRTRGVPEEAAPAIRDAIRAVDRQMAIISMQPLERAVSDAVAQPRFRAVVVGTLSIIAIALAAVGLAGLVAYAVSQRTTEIGIRMALGATAGDVGRLIVGDAAAVALAGIAAGVTLALVGARLLDAFLYGVAARDPLSFAVAAALLFGIALVASYLPARRATRIDPAVALRAE